MNKIIEEIKRLRTVTVERLNTLPDPDERSFYLQGKQEALDEALRLEGRRDALDEMLVLLNEPGGDAGTHDGMLSENLHEQ